MYGAICIGLRHVYAIDATISIHAHLFYDNYYDYYALSGCKSWLTINSSLPIMANIQSSSHAQWVTFYFGILFH